MSNPYLYLFVLFAVLSIFAGYYAVKFAMMVLRFQDALEDSLDVIDEKYKSITAICERPLFFDSPEVRQVLEDIKETREALHGIAFSLSRDFEFNDENVENNEHAEG